MKKCVLLLISIFIMADHCLAQYDALIKPGKKWYYSKFNGEKWNDGGKDFITNDTIIFNGKKYYYGNINSCYPNNDTILLREDNKRVYIVGLGNSVFNRKERLLFDFNLEKGDSFKFDVPAGNNPDEFKDSIIQITFKVDTTYKRDNRKHIVFKEIYSDNLHIIPPQTWIEGIGNKKGWLVYLYNRLSFEASEQTCALKQMCDNNLRILPNVGICNDSIALVHDIKSNILSISPNPAKKYFSIKLLSIEKHDIVIYNSSGQKMDEIKLQGSYEYRIAFDYPKGIYFVRVINNKTKSKSILVVE